MIVIPSDGERIDTLKAIRSRCQWAKIDTLGSKYKFFHEWKHLKEEDKCNVELKL